MRQLGSYRVVAEIGRGGMGVVYKAHDIALQRSIAIKMLSGPVAQDPEVRERFAREARSMASLANPHVVAVHAIGEQAGKSFFVMELIDGESLSSVLSRQNRLTAADAAVVIYQAALGLAAAHQKGIVHRDVKPANIMLSRAGVVKVSDFGISRAPGAPTATNRKLTMTGDFMGTPGYMSPEACQGETVDARTDVFSLGIVLYECLTGEVPFNSPSPLVHMLQIVESRIPDVREINAEVDDLLLSVLEKMMSKHPKDRFADGGAVVAALAAHPAVKSHHTLSFAIRSTPTKPLATPVDHINPEGATQLRAPRPTRDWNFSEVPVTAKEYRPIRLTWLLVFVALLIGGYELWPWMEQRGWPAIQEWWTWAENTFREFTGTR